jgi:hypothetical protein
MPCPHTGIYLLGQPFFNNNLILYLQLDEKWKTTREKQMTITEYLQSLKLWQDTTKVLHLNNIYSRK